jgi:hypothetical protein
MASGAPVLTLQPQQNILARPRKESLFDTEGANNAVVHPNLLTLFRDFGAFQVAGLTLTKQQGRDVNIVGRAGLPKGQSFYWFEITHNIMARFEDLTTAANVDMFDVLRRIRELCDWEMRFTDTPYLRQPLSELPAGVGPAFVQTTHTDATVMSYAWGVPHRDNAYNVTIDGQPASITEQESFSVRIALQEQPPTPTTELYHQTHLRGVYLKGVTG